MKAPKLNSNALSARDAEGSVERNEVPVVNAITTLDARRFRERFRNSKPLKFLSYSAVVAGSGDPGKRMRSKL
jgi:hypothetical protein